MRTMYFLTAAAVTLPLLLSGCGSRHDVKSTMRQMRESNSFIPDDSRFHTFLTGKDGKPVFIGDPYVSKSMWDLFMSAVRQICI